MPLLPKIPKKTVRATPYVSKPTKLVRKNTLLNRASMTTNTGNDDEYVINYNNMNKIKNEINDVLLNETFYSDHKKYIKDAMSLIGENKITAELKNNIDKITLGTGVLRVDFSRQSLAYFYNTNGDFDEKINGRYQSKQDDFPNIVLRYQTRKNSFDDSHSIIINLSKDFHVSFFRNYSDSGIPDDASINGSRNSRLHLTSNGTERLYLTGSELEFTLESDKLIGLFNRLIHYITYRTYYNYDTPLDPTYKMFFANITDKMNVIDNLKKLKSLFYSQQMGGKNKNLQKIEKLKNNIKLLKMKISKHNEAINKLMRKNKEAKTKTNKIKKQKLIK